MSDQFRLIDYEGTQDGQFQVITPGGAGTPTVEMGGFALDIESVPGYRKPQRVGFCKGNDNTCKARPVKGGDLCVGHQRAADKVSDEQE